MFSYIALYKTNHISLSIIPYTKINERVGPTRKLKIALARHRLIQKKAYHVRNHVTQKINSYGFIELGSFGF